MACTLTTGRKLPCKSAFGGIKKVFFADYGDITAITVDAQLVKQHLREHQLGMNMM